MLRRIFVSHGLPDKMISDNGLAFASAEIQQFLTSNSIDFRYVAPAHPSSNGQAERMVAYTKQVLDALEEGDTNLQVARFLFRQHTTPHSTTGKTPAEMLMGRRLRTHLDKLHPNSMRENNEYYFDEAITRTFSIGDMVFIRNYLSGPKWLPATVIEITGPVSYVMELLDGRIARRHVDQIRDRVIPDAQITQQENIPPLRVENSRPRSPTHMQLMREETTEGAVDDNPTDTETPVSPSQVTELGDEAEEVSGGEPRRGARLRQIPERYVPS